MFSGFGEFCFDLGFFELVVFVGFVLCCWFFPASVQYTSYGTFFHVKSVFPIQLPKASRTSVQGGKDPPVAAQPKASGLPMRKTLEGHVEHAFTLTSVEESLSNSPQR